jgi:hypothetical protein
MMAAGVVMELLMTVLNGTVDTVVVILLAMSLPPAKEQNEANQGDETANGDAHNRPDGQGKSAGS